MRRKLMFLTCTLFAIGAVACSNVSTVENDPVETVVIEEPDTGNIDTPDVDSPDADIPDANTSDVNTPDDTNDNAEDAAQNEQYIKVYNYDRFATNNEEDFKKSMRNVINDASEEQEFIKRFIGENADITVSENSVYKMVTSESGDKESIVFFVKGEDSVYPELAFGLQFDKNEAVEDAVLTDDSDKDLFDRISALDGSEYYLTDLLKPLTDFQDINYVSDKNGKKVKAEYSSDPALYGTYNSKGTLYYDENERPVLKSYYVTSGSKHMAYVYDDNDKLVMICEFGGMAYGPLEEYPGAEIGIEFSVYFLP